jgi:alpha-D-xyloside xylohydrolase
MRPLVMDFPHDSEARDIADQYLVGSGLMVSPITEYKARLRNVYLPSAPGNEATRWYDFWNGTQVTAGAGTTQPATVLPSGGMTIEAAASYDQIPLHVRAGTILPTGPEFQYTTEKKPDPLTVWVYTGANGSFSLYEDDGLSYQYEKNAFSRIPMTWNESTRTLTLGRRQGQFPGMLAERTIRIVFVSPENPIPFAFEPKADKIVKYQGEALAIRP